jgi:hypothetical protein
MKAHRSATGPSGRRRPLLFQELVFHPQPPDLIIEFLHTCTLHRRQRLIRFGMLPPPGIDPVPQSPIVDPQVPGHLSDRLSRRNHHLHGLSLELRAELAAMLWPSTDPLSWTESHCPRSLIHLNKTFASRMHAKRQPGFGGMEPREPGGSQPGVDRVVDRPPAKSQCNQRFRRSPPWRLCS